MDKRDRAILFRLRLTEGMTRKGLNRSALARAIGVDRSTMGQLLKPDSTRLPNAGLAAEAASALGVSTDWLLGLTNRPERPGEIISAAMALSPAERSSADAQLMEWHREATGFKIRHVPATLPDLLKTDAMLDWEYAAVRDQHSAPAIDATHQQRQWLQSGQSDYEIALPLHEIQACATGTAYYTGLSADIRHQQLTHIAQLATDLFPRLRISLFDARKLFSAPVTVFGPRLAIVYIGQSYLAFREAARIRALTDHFDHLIRGASVEPRDVPAYIQTHL